MKKFSTNTNIGKAKYVVNFHDGKTFHKDGSDFYGIRIFSNKVDNRKFINQLLVDGYKED